MKTTIAKPQKLKNRLLIFYKCEVKKFNKILGLNKTK